jgi:hypothetical protein
MSTCQTKWFTDLKITYMQHKYYADNCQPYCICVRIQCSIHLATETTRHIQSILLGLNVSKFEGCFIFLMSITCLFPPSTWLVSWVGYIITLDNLTGSKWQQPTAVRWNNDPALWLLSSGILYVIFYSIIMFSWNLYTKLHSVVYEKNIILTLSCYDCQRK